MFSGSSIHKLQHQNSAQSCSGALDQGTRNLTCSTAARSSCLLPSNHTASISHPMKQSRAKSPETWHATIPTAVGLGGGIENIPDTHCPAPLHCLAHKMDGTWILQLLLGTLTVFWGAKPGCKEFWYGGNRRQTWPSLGVCTHICQSPLAWQNHTAAVLPAEPYSVELSHSCSSTLTTLH